MKIIFLAWLLMFYALIPGVWFTRFNKYFILSINSSNISPKKELLKHVLHILNKDNETMLICYNPYCPHCEHLLWFLGTLNCSEHMNIIKLSTMDPNQLWVCERVLDRYNISFDAVPTMVIVKSGGLMFYVVGFVNQSSEEFCGHKLCPWNDAYVPTRDVIKGIYCLNSSLISRFIWAHQKSSS